MSKPFYLWLACAVTTAVYGCSANSTNQAGLSDDDGSGNGSSTGGSFGVGGNGAGGGIVPVDKCGNGMVEPPEQCDDANKVSGDGCTGSVPGGLSCQLEGNAQCMPGQMCTTVSVCGDGFVTALDGCDDANVNDGDGCPANCSAVEPGWQCRIPGRACTPLCGDGAVVGTEQCDDGNPNNDDGCSSNCVIEPGSSCTPPMPGVPSVCTKAVCGNGAQEAGEGCDAGPLNGLFNGNATGCSKTCTKEPVCRDASGVTQACASVCGDANVDAMAGEGCDDGNAVSGDGCSATCQLETGFNCSDMPATDTQTCSTGAGQCLVLPITFRDFDGQNQAMGHPDFYYLNNPANTCVPNASGRAVGANGDGGATACWDSDSTPLCKAISGATLGPDGKPVPGATTTCACRFTDWDNSGLIGATNVCYDAGGNARNRLETMVKVVDSPQSFKEWYSDSTKSQKVVSAIELAPLGTDFQYSSSNGRTVYSDLHDIFMGTAIPAVNGGVANSLSSGFFPLEAQTGVGAAKLCNLWPYWTVGTGPCVANDGNPVWQQWDPQGSYEAGVAGMGGPVKPVTGNQRNFYFTSEIRYLFRYGGSGTLAFYGDDDVWVYINGRLALDLGAPHERLQGTVTMTGASATWAILTTDTATGAAVPPVMGGSGTVDLGLETGKTYEITVFHADRHPRESNYQLTLSAFPTTKTTCVPRCGDGVATAAEECDCGDGTATPGAGCIGPNDDMAYGGCTTMCKWGPFCGDGVVNGPEACDNGAQNGDLSLRPTPCTTACVIAPICGDGKKDPGEQCDEGPANGTSGSGCDLACVLVAR
jgi:fibro-slime domain-containing protein